MDSPTSRAAITLVLATGLAASLIPLSRANAGQFDAGVALSSDYVLYGLTRSQGKPVVQAQLGWADEGGWSLGTWFSTVDFNDGPGVSRELDFYLAKRWSLGKDLALLTELTQYTFNESSSQPSYDYGELRAALSFRELIELSASVSPDYSAYSRIGVAREKTVFTYGATARFPATRRLSFTLGVGRFDLQNAFDRTYTYWSGGGALKFGQFELAVSYIGSDSVATELFGSQRADDRLVATLAMRIP